MFYDLFLIFFCGHLCNFLALRLQPSTLDAQRWDSPAATGGGRPHLRAQERGGHMSQLGELPAKGSGGQGSLSSGEMKRAAEGPAHRPQPSAYRSPSALPGWKENGVKHLI